MYLLLPTFVGHRHLHSFPTRRSSDLTRRRSALRRKRSRRSRAPPAILKIIPRGRRGCCARRSAAPTASIRSEEHTSELQSRRELVCRLLLEKKKTDTEARAVLKDS